jgi:hypothetical protein
MILTIACALCPFILAGEPVRFDDALRPHFTEKQMRAVSLATRDGLAKWAATPQGARLIERFSAKEYRIVVTEDLHELSPGRAPQPGIATLANAADRSRLKSYEILLNPSFFRVMKEQARYPNEPQSPADVMAAAFAAEMLHVDFYSRGVSLPHHERADFQREWRTIAADLGMIGLRHDDSDERDGARRGPLVQFVGPPW